MNLQTFLMVDKEYPWATSFTPPWWLRNGLVMTLYVALASRSAWYPYLSTTEPSYQEHIFSGQGNVPLFGWVSIPSRPIKGTIIGTYGITGNLEDQWYLRLLGSKAYHRDYAVVLFDWRAHGKTGLLSPTLTSDGLYEGEDFIQIAAQAKRLGCPPPYWFTGYSLGAQLALWGVKMSQTSAIVDLIPGIDSEEVAGAAVICPSLESQRSLSYLVKHPLGRYLEKEVASKLKKLAYDLHSAHPGFLDPEAIARANTIWGFDHELVIGRLGFPSVEAYYAASSPLYFLPHLQKPTLILYSLDDPMFDPGLVPELLRIDNPSLEVLLTSFGGHAAYFSRDPDPWWAWNSILNWLDFNHA